MDANNAGSQEFIASGRVIHMVDYTDEGHDEFDLVTFGSARRLDELERIVRCRDCKRSNDDRLWHQLWCNGSKVEPDGFCAWGIPKD